MNQALMTLLKGQNLDQLQAESLFTDILDGELNEVGIAAALTALKVKGETGLEISALVQTLRQKAQSILPPSGSYVDCCGTGGDGLKTFNVSTAAALTAATCGLAMVKHGNRASSSPSGSADIIEQLGIPLHATPEQSLELLAKTNFCFLFAPAYHPLVGRVMPVRKALATATIFNLAGPLANPVSPDVQLMGVCDATLLQPMADVLQQTGCQRGLVVYGSGLDEVALHGPTDAILVTPDSQQRLVIQPDDLGISSQPLSTIQLQPDDQPVKVFNEVIQGQASAAKIDMVALNAGVLLWLSGKVDTQLAGVEQARQALINGDVADKVTQIQTICQQWGHS